MRVGEGRDVNRVLFGSGWSRPFGTSTSGKMIRFLLFHTTEEEDFILSGAILNDQSPKRFSSGRLTQKTPSCITEVCSLLFAVAIP